MEQPSPHKRREWWPYAIIGSFVIFIGGIFFGIYMMSTANVPLVAPNYYEQEIAYQEQIDKESRALDHAPEVKFDKNPGPGVWLTFAPGQKATPGVGQITFFRPSDETLDFSVPVNPDGQGRQWIDLSQARTGLWMVQVEWQEDDQMHYHESQLLVSK